jgi:hypothetical protein
MCTTIVQQWQLVKLKSNDCCDENKCQFKGTHEWFGFFNNFFGLNFGHYK